MKSLIDKGGVNGLGPPHSRLGQICFRRIQSGSIRNYATWVLAGSLLIIFVMGLMGGASMNLLSRSSCYCR